MAVRIIVDSASDILPSEAKELGMLHCPLKVLFGDQEYADSVDLTHKEFYEKLASSKDMPQTSLINSFRWNEAFEAATKNGDEVVAITLSSKISGTFEAAVEAQIAALSDNYVVGTNLSTALAPQVSIAWAFNGGNDTADTYLGNQASIGNAPTVSLTITATVTQID